MKRLRVDDGTWWPHPDDDRLGWRLRYQQATITPEDMIRCAEYISAYQDLIEHPAGAGTMVRKLRALRRAVRAEEQKR